MTNETFHCVCKVPRIIHYCWFGHGELSKQAKKTLVSWECYAPGYEIRRCDESNFNINSCGWTRKAYEAEKYAFVADCARFQMLYEFGGVYMDLGSELIRDITELVETCSPFSAIEELSKTATTGLIVAVPPYNPLIASVLARYQSMVFLDEPAFLTANTTNEIFTSELEKFGFVRENRRQRVGEWTLLPSSAFNPVYGFGGYHIKKDTYSVHSSSGSWAEPSIKIKKNIQGKWAPFVGRRLSQIIGRITGELKCYGLRRGLKNLRAVAHDCKMRERGKE